MPAIAVQVLLLICTAPARATTISGASLATCAPGPCQPPTSIGTVTLSGVSNGDGTVSTRTYGIYRPSNLTGLAPAMLVFYGGGNCGVVPVSRFSTLAPANRFIVIYMAVPCGRSNLWNKRNVDTVAAAVPNDEAYVNAVVKDIVRCPGQCVDPQRIYAAGMSSGGNMVADVMCDPQNSTLFRGYLIDSSSLQLFGGVPHCPSTNRSFFVMLALSNYGVDAGLYYDTASSPHLDVPSFASWATGRLGCAGPPQLGALGTPLPTTLVYRAVGPCAYAAAGSVAASVLGVINGSHGWSCQDSDPHSPPGGCTVMPTPPGLGANGLPKTNGLFLEGEFWSFLANGVSSSAPAPPLPEVPSPPLGAPPPSVLPPTNVREPSKAVTSGPVKALGWLALGDGFAAGEGAGPYLAGSDTSEDRCHRSARAYPFLAARHLGIASGLVSDHACSGASLGAFYHPNARDHEPRQLSWVNGAAGVVTLMTGWNDSSIPARILRCGRDPRHCPSYWGQGFGGSLDALGGSAQSRYSLRRLYKTVLSAAPTASIVAVGYPSPFPANPSRSCRLKLGRLRFDRRSMLWIDRQVKRLDDTIQAAAAAQRIPYVRGSYAAFHGHELCSRQSDLSDSLQADPEGQAALALALERTFP